ncbi:hypothetical protein NC651_018164 [Populus alba x Populus x berolinensis]|nr:hypothetical protein NC651_018164 [Populus alba x Populus x berolinensis]
MNQRAIAQYGTSTSQPVAPRHTTSRRGNSGRAFRGLRWWISVEVESRRNTPQRTSRTLIPLPYRT